MKTNILILIVLAFVILTSCETKKKQLQEKISKFNTELPVSLGDIMTINSISLENDEVVMKFTANEKIASIPAMNNHTNELKDILCMSFSKEMSKDLINDIIEAEVAFRVVMVGNVSNKRVEIVLSSNELKLGQSKFMNLTDSQKFIVSNVFASKIKLPVQIDATTTLIDLVITENYLVYKYELDDFEIGEDIKQVATFAKSITLSQIIESVKKGILRGRNMQFYKALIECNQGIEIYYYEKNTKKSTSVKISNSELSDAINGKKNVPTMDEWEKLSNAIEELEELIKE